MFKRQGTNSALLQCTQILILRFGRGNLDINKALIYY